VLLSVTSRLVTTSTRPASASPMAARNPAIPPPTTMKSVSDGSDDMEGISMVAREFHMFLLCVRAPTSVVPRRIVASQFLAAAGWSVDRRSERQIKIASFLGLRFAARGPRQRGSGTPRGLYGTTEVDALTRTSHCVRRLLLQAATDKPLRTSAPSHFP
jgi:hypothetical protein